MYLGGTNSADKIVSLGTDDFVYGFDGNDILADGFNFLPSNDTFRGGNGNDQITSYHGTDALYGQAGNDRLTVDGRADNVTAYGGKGYDILFLWRDDLMYPEDEQFMHDHPGQSMLVQFKQGGVIDISGIEFFVFM